MAGLDLYSLSYYDLDDISLFLKGKQAANLDQWRMVRRLCYIQGLSMGSKLTDETQLWTIEGDKKGIENPTEKIEKYKEALISIGKWQKKN